MQNNTKTIKTMEIEVVYAKPEQQILVSLNLPVDSIVLEAIQQSGILSSLSSTETETLSERVGIFGEKVSLSTPLKEGDRLEIYRSLKKDPKEARKERARKQRLNLNANPPRDRS